VCAFVSSRGGSGGVVRGVEGGVVGGIVEGVEDEGGSPLGAHTAHCAGEPLAHHLVLTAQLHHHQVGWGKQDMTIRVKRPHPPMVIQWCGNNLTHSLQQG
jgi:hypothetical protein